MKKNITTTIDVEKLKTLKNRKISVSKFLDNAINDLLNGTSSEDLKIKISNLENNILKFQNLIENLSNENIKLKDNLNEKQKV